MTQFGGPMVARINELIKQHLAALKDLEQFRRKYSVIAEWEARKERLEQIEEELRALIKQFALENKDLMTYEFENGYGFKKTLVDTVNTRRLIEKFPDVVKEYPEGFSISLKALRDLIANGKLPSEAQRCVEKGEPRITVRLKEN